jgi:hypothetical protein
MDDDTWEEEGERPANKWVQRVEHFAHQHEDADMGMGYLSSLGAPDEPEVQGQVEIQEEATQGAEEAPTVVLNVPAPPAWWDMGTFAMIAGVVGYSLYCVHTMIGDWKAAPFLLIASATSLLYIKHRS